MYCSLGEAQMLLTGRFGGGANPPALAAGGRRLRRACSPPRAGSWAGFPARKSPGALLSKIFFLMVLRLQSKRLAGYEIYLSTPYGRRANSSSESDTSTYQLYYSLSPTQPFKVLETPGPIRGPETPGHSWYSRCCYCGY